MVGCLLLWGSLFVQAQPWSVDTGRWRHTRRRALVRLPPPLMAPPSVMSVGPRGKMVPLAGLVTHPPCVSGCCDASLRFVDEQRSATRPIESWLLLRQVNVSP